uniref:hypothetical protein n=1 Tax=uncultured Planktosalinus sp. TaxID=1810935 RepID=UPI0030D94004
MELNEIIEQKVSSFKERLSDKSTSEKKLFHYYSVLNISKRLLVYNDSNTHSLKEILLQFFIEVENYNYLISDKVKSLRLYKKYLLPSELYLFKKENFLSNVDL